MLHNDPIEHLIALLSRLRLELEQEFPNAWSFARSGFDDVDAA